MQAIEKHMAAGGCLVIKQAVAKGDELDQLLDTLLHDRRSREQVLHSQTQQEAVSSPQKADMGFVDKSPHVIASEHAEDVRKFSPARMLGGQRMVDIKKMKTDWGAFHAESEAEEHCRTQSKAA